MNNLKAARIKKNLSQIDLVKLSGVTRSRISQIENGNIDNVKLKEMKILSKVLGSTIQDLFFS